MRIYLFLIVYFTLSLSGCRKNSDSDQTNTTADELQSFSYLNEHVGQTPSSVNLWTTEPLQSALTKLLGSQYHTFIKHMENAKVLKRDKVIYTIAALPDSAAHGYAIALFDTAAIQAEVFFLKKDTTLAYAAERNRLYWPDEVRHLMYNYQGWHVYEGVLPCTGCPGILTTLPIKQGGTGDQPQYFLQQVYPDTSQDHEVLQQRGAGLIRRITYSDTIATIYQLEGEDAEKKLNFLRIDENQLELLDQELQKADTEHNTRLHKVN